METASIKSDTIPQCLRAYVRESGLKLKKSVECKQYGIDAEAVRDEIEKADPDGLQIETLSYCDIWNAILMTGYIDHYRDVVELARALGRRGYRMVKEPEVQQYAIEWRWIQAKDRPGCREHDSFDIRFTGYLKSNGTCRRVKIGTKLVEVDQYEIQCADKKVAFEKEETDEKLLS